MSKNFFVDPKFNCLYSELFPVVYRVAYRISGDAAISEDLTHEAFVQLLRREGVLLGVSDAKYWLLRVIRNLSLNYEKKRVRERRAFLRLEKETQSEANGPDMKLIEDVVRGEVQTCLDGLPYQLRTVIVLREYAQFSYNEIGTVLGISHSNVKIRIYRARKLLAKLIKERKHYVSKP